MNRRANKKGLVIIVVLWVTVLLTIIVASVARNGQLDTKLCVSSIDSVRCKWASRAGIDTAIAVLNEDAKDSDGLMDTWSYNIEEFNNIQIGNSRYSVVVTDECGKLNVNTATREQLLMLPNMTEQIADAIIDWRDTDDEPNQTGVESGYYMNLAYGYRIRNGPFRTIRELLSVRGITEELLYGINSGLDGQVASTDAGISAYERGENNLYEPWIEYLTCYSFDTNLDADGNTKINVNTADQTTLVDSLGLTQANASWIIQQRRSSRFTSIADLLSSSTTTMSQSSGQTGGSSQGTSQSGGRQGTSQSSQSLGQGTALDTTTFTSIAEKITINDVNIIEGKININTAPGPVLMAVFADSNDAQQIAENIIAYRNNLPDGIKSIGELVSVLSMDTATFKKAAELMTVRSYVFGIRSFAKTERGGLQTAQLLTEAAVNRGTKPSKVLYWYQGQTN
jgi:type II secretory pathway component PulK